MKKKVRVQKVTPIFNLCSPKGSKSPSSPSGPNMRGPVSKTAAAKLEWHHGPHQGVDFHMQKIGFSTFNKKSANVKKFSSQCHTDFNLSDSKFLVPTIN